MGGALRWSDGTSRFRRGRERCERSGELGSALKALLRLPSKATQNDIFDLGREVGAVGAWRKRLRLEHASADLGDVRTLER